MRKMSWISGLVACVLTLGLAPAASAHEADDLGRYTADGRHLSHASFSWQSLVPLGADVISQNVRHVKNVSGTTGGHSVVEGDLLYQGAYGLGFRIFDIKDPANPVEVGRYIPGPKDASDPGLRADAVPDVGVFDGKTIVAFGGTRRRPETTRTDFVDVTDPKSPKLLAATIGAADGEAHNSDVVDARRLWIPSGGVTSNGLRIYDMNPLLGERPSAPTNLFRGDPAELWNKSPYRGKKPVGKTPFTHTHDVEAYVDRPVLLPQDQWTDQDGDGTPDPTTALRDILLLAEGGDYVAGNDRGSIFVIDITNPQDPVVINRWSNNMQGHPIRYYHEIQFVHGNPNVMIVTDEDLHNGCNAGGMVALHISDDLMHIEKLSEFFIGQGTPAPICSAHVFSTHNNIMYMGSYNAGLQIFDLSNPAQPKKVGYYIYPGMDSWGALYHKGVIYTGDLGARGLDVFQYTPPTG